MKEMFVEIYSNRQALEDALDKRFEGVMEFANATYLHKGNIPYCYMPFMYNHNQEQEEWQLFFHSVKLGIA